MKILGLVRFASARVGANLILVLRPRSPQTRLAPASSFCLLAVEGCLGGEVGASSRSGSWISIPLCTSFLLHNFGGVGLVEVGWFDKIYTNAFEVLGLAG